MSYPTVNSAISKIVFDAQVKAIKEFKDFLADRVDISDMESDFDEFLQTLKPTAAPAEKKTTKANPEPSKKKREPTLFNFFVKDRMVSLKEENPEAKGKVILTMASEAWKSDPFATFLKENLKTLKEESSDSSNESLYQLAKEKFNALSDESETSKPTKPTKAVKAVKAPKKGKKAEPEPESGSEDESGSD